VEARYVRDFGEGYRAIYLPAYDFADQEDRNFQVQYIEID